MRYVIFGALTLYGVALGVLDAIGRRLFIPR